MSDRSLSLTIDPTKGYLLRMPQEIINEILRCLLVATDSILHFYQSAEEDSMVKNLSRVALTCHQLYANALEIYFGQNAFECNTHCQRISMGIKLQHRKYIRKLVVHWSHPRLAAHVFRFLADCNSLKHLKLVVSRNAADAKRTHFKKRRAGDRTNLMKATGMGTLRKLRGLSYVSIIDVGRYCDFEEGDRDFEEDHTLEVNTILNAELCRPRKESPQEPAPKRARNINTHTRMIQTRSRSQPQ